MTKALSAPRSSLQVSNPATARDLTIELERLAIHFPRTDMDARKWQLLFETFRLDFQGMTLAEIQNGCRRYRKNPENRFFPTPGQLLAACANPYDSPKGKTYDPLPALPMVGECVTPERMRETLKQHGFADRKNDLAGRNGEILTRQRIPYVPMTQELLRCIKQTLRHRYPADEAQKYIAELPSTSEAAPGEPRGNSEQVACSDFTGRPDREDDFHAVWHPGGP